MFLPGICRRQQPLFAEDEDALLAFEAHLAYLSVCAEENRGIACGGVAVFPAALALSNRLAVAFHRGFVSVNHQAIFAGLQSGFAELRGLRNVDGFCEGFRECWDGQDEHGQQRGCRQRKKGSVSHACQVPFARIHQPRGFTGQRRVDTQDGMRVASRPRHLLFLD